MVWEHYMCHMLWFTETIPSLYGTQWPYQQYGMVVGNYINAVCCGDTIYATCYGSWKPYQACMVPSDYINTMGWFQETILMLYGVGTLYGICYGSWKPYQFCMVPSGHINNTAWLWETILTLYGTRWPSEKYRMVLGNRTNPVWYLVTISTIQDSCGQPY